MTFNTKIIENAEDLRPRCSRCLLWSTLCLCSELPQFQNRTRITLMLQWSEYWRISNSGRIANLCLKESSLIVRGKPGGEPLEAHTPNPEEIPILLFPGPGVEVISPEILDNAPLRLYVPDGTWREASKIARRTDFLRGMRRVQLPLGLSSQYRLRKSQRPGGVSTIEAVAKALEILGETETASGLTHVLGLLKRCLSSGWRETPFW